mmetsp:Transcript_23135/g.68249  ORF Transcript_23135/g.68249 Transcript_23135/m.68249 type:complete len:253 (-) Transcript_23135:813-1571(-)
MYDGDDGLAGIGEGAEGFDDLGGLIRIEAGRRLVQEYYRRTRDHLARDAQSLPFPPAQSPNLGVPHDGIRAPRQSQLFHQSVHDVVPRASAQFFPQPQLHPEIQSLLDGHVREKGHVLLDERRGELGVSRDGFVVDVSRAVQTHPGGILDPARQGVDQGGFSGAGRTHNGEHPSRPRLSPDGSVQYDTILLLLLLLFQRHANVRETYLHILEESAIHARIILNDDFLLVLLFVVVRAELHHLPPRMRRLRYE